MKKIECLAMWVFNYIAFIIAGYCIFFKNDIATALAIMIIDGCFCLRQILIKIDNRQMKTTES